MINIDAYYDSIKEVYEKIESWKPPKPPFREKLVDGFLIFGIVLFILSLVPIAPILLIIIGGNFNISIYTIALKNVSIVDFLKIWGSAALLSLIFMLVWIWINNKVDTIVKEPANPPYSLSPEQLSFIAVYKSYKELRNFFISHIEQHIDNSHKALKKAFPISNRYVSVLGEKAEHNHIYNSDEELFEIIRQERSVIYRGTPNLVIQVHVASNFLNTFEKYAWFQLDPQTKSTLQAFISFPEKIPPRLRNREDLPRVHSVLENFSKYLFAYLPEHDTYMETAVLNDLHSEGAQCLENFTQEVNNLTIYK